MSIPICWAVAGLALLILEFFVPGVFLMFFGFGAIVTALSAWIFPGMTLPLQWGVFSVLSLVLLLSLRKWMAQTFRGRVTVSADGLDDDFAGHAATAVTDIAPGRPGKVELNGADWTAEAEEPIPAGAPVTIVARKGLVLTVRKA